MLMVQDMALCEEADNTTLQPQHDLPGETGLHQGKKCFKDGNTMRKCVFGTYVNSKLPC